MTFSIIIPVYNVEKYLRQCLDSVFSQNFISFEVICVNDGSTDGSLAILKEYADRDSRIIIISQPNMGLSAARNIGIKLAKGDYVFLLDSDDWIEQKTLEILNNSITDEEIITFNGRRWFEDGKTEEPDPGINEKQLNGWDYYNKYALTSRKFHFVSAVLRLYKRSFLIDNNLFFKEGIYHEDNLFTPIACYYAQKVKVIPDCLYVYRIRGGSITQSISEKSFIDVITVANELLHFFLDENNKDGNKNVIFHDIAYYYPNILINIRKTGKNSLIQTVYAMIDWEGYKKISKGWGKVMFYMVKYRIPLFYNYKLIHKIKRKINVKFA